MEGSYNTVEIRRILHIHKDNNHMGIHTIGYIRNCLGIVHFRGSPLLILLEMDHRFQIHILGYQKDLHYVHIHTYANAVASVSPFLTYPIRDGRSVGG